MQTSTVCANCSDLRDDDTDFLGASRDTEDLWGRFGAERFFESVDKYRAFAAGSRKITFIRFGNFREFAEPKPKDEVVRVLGSLVWFRPKYISQHNVELLTEPS